MASPLGGLLGNQAFGQQAGILGMNPDDLGILASSLKDAMSYFNGRSQDANGLLPAIQQAAQHQQVQRLLQTVNSSDPAARQQGYTALMAAGGDPAPFKAAQAAQQLPQLMAMQQNPQVQITPQVSAANPVNSPMRTAAGNFNTAIQNAPNFSPSIADTVTAMAPQDPEAAQSLALPMLQQQMATQAAKQKVQVRQATPQEMVAHGYKPTDPGTINDFTGALSSPVKPAAAIQQDIDQKTQESTIPKAPEGPMSQAVFGQQMALKTAGVKAQMAALNGSMDPNTIDYVAQQYNLTGQMPSLGMGQAATAMRAQIMKRASEIAAGNGQTGADMVAVHAGSKANTQALGQVAKQGAMASSFENTANQNADLAMSLMDKGTGSTNIPIINSWSRAGGKALGNPDVAKFDTAIATFKEEYGKIMSGATSATGISDSARRQADGLINPNMSREQILGNIQVMKQEMQNRMNSVTAEQGSLRSALGQGSANKPLGMPTQALPRLPKTGGTTKSGVKFQIIGQ